MPTLQRSPFGCYSISGQGEEIDICRECGGLWFEKMK
ncbi:zf-TFIIB domain-containing protein [Pseudoalteromonas prydzensis]